MTQHLNFLLQVFTPSVCQNSRKTFCVTTWFNTSNLSIWNPLRKNRNWKHSAGITWSLETNVRRFDTWLIERFANSFFCPLALPSVNNVSILSNATLSNGNDIFVINEVLFMSESVVSKLHQQNKDKETPPLLAFPWFGSQFLSHAFLALERDNRFTQVTRWA